MIRVLWRVRELNFNKQNSVRNKTITPKKSNNGVGNTGSVVNDNARNITSISNANVNKVGPWYTDSGSIAVNCYKNNDVPNYCQTYAGAKNSNSAVKYMTLKDAGVPISNYLIITPESYNQTINPNASISFGFGGNGAMPNPLNYKLVYVVDGTEYTVQQ